MFPWFLYTETSTKHLSSRIYNRKGERKKNESREKTEENWKSRRSFVLQQTILPLTAEAFKVTSNKHEWIKTGNIFGFLSVYNFFLFFTCSTTGITPISRRKRISSDKFLLSTKCITKHLFLLVNKVLSGRHLFCPPFRKKKKLQNKCWNYYHNFYYYY